MEISDFNIRNTSKRTVIMPFGCIHQDHPNHHKQLWKQFLKEAQEREAYLIGMGDYIDFARTHYRSHIKSYQGDEESVLHVDRMVRERMETFAQDLMPLQKRVVGLIEGNHSWRFEDGTTSTQYLCQLLECKYLGLSSFIRFNIATGKDRDIGNTFLILCHHGQGGGGAYLASDIGKFERQIAPGWDADIYLSSHTHRKAAVMVPSITVTKKGQGKLLEKQRLFVKTGCFKKAYCEGATSRSYEESKLFHPSELGWVNIYIDRVEGHRRLKNFNAKNPTEIPVRRFELRHEY